MTNPQCECVTHILSLAGNVQRQIDELQAKDPKEQHDHIGLVALAAQQQILSVALRHCVDLRQGSPSATK